MESISEWVETMILLAAKEITESMNVNVSPKKSTMKASQFLTNANLKLREFGTKQDPWFSEHE